MIYNRLKNLRFFRTLLTLFNNISLHRKIVLTYFFFIFMLVGILAAVSYTHLDVYKRQVPASPCILSRTSFFSPQETGAFPTA